MATVTLLHLMSKAILPWVSMAGHYKWIIMEVTLHVALPFKKASPHTKMHNLGDVHKHTYLTSSWDDVRGKKNVSKHIVNHNSKLKEDALFLIFSPRSIYRYIGHTEVAPWPIRSVLVVWCTNTILLGYHLSMVSSMCWFLINHNPLTLRSLRKFESMFDFVPRMLFHRAQEWISHGQRSQQSSKTEFSEGTFWRNKLTISKYVTSRWVGLRQEEPRHLER